MTVSYLILAGAGSSLALLVIGVVVLDIGVQSGRSRTRRVRSPPIQPGRINSLYMTATFVGGALGATVSGALMARFGMAWSRSVSRPETAAFVHRCGERR